MILTTLSGKKIVLNVTQSKFPIKSKDSSRSIFQYNVGQILVKKYPNLSILEEFYIPIENIYLDFFIPRLMIAVECQGAQHTAFNKLYHKNLTHFRSQVDRDYKKLSFCNQNNILLVTVPYSNNVNKDIVISIIDNTINEGI